MEPDVRRRTGLVLDPYFSGTKLTWLLREHPDLRRRAEEGGLAFGTIDSWLIARLILAVVNDAFHVTFPMKYPAWPLGIALAAALLVAALALARPLRRASRLPPSEALRYQ